MQLLCCQTSKSVFSVCFCLELQYASLMLITQKKIGQLHCAQCVLYQYYLLYLTFPLFLVDRVLTEVFCVAVSDLSEVTRILSSLEEWNRSSFSLKYSSMHCSSKSCTFFSSSSVMKSSVDDRVGE